MHPSRQGPDGDPGARRPPRSPAITLSPSTFPGGSDREPRRWRAPRRRAAEATLTSSNTTRATAPSSVTIPAGATSATFPVEHGFGDHLGPRRRSRRFVGRVEPQRRVERITSRPGRPKWDAHGDGVRLATESMSRLAPPASMWRSAAVCPLPSLDGDLDYAHRFERTQGQLVRRLLRHVAKTCTFTFSPATPRFPRTCSKSRNSSTQKPWDLIRSPGLLRVIRRLVTLPPPYAVCIPAASVRAPSARYSSKANRSEVRSHELDAPQFPQDCSRFTRGFVAGQLPGPGGASTRRWSRSRPSRRFNWITSATAA